MPKSKESNFERNKKEIIKMYLEGKPLLEIEKSFKISRHTLKKYLEKLGYKRTKQEVYKIIQKAKEEALLEKYGVINVSQINDPELQERRLRGVRERRKGAWQGEDNPNYKNKIGNNFGYKNGRRKDLDDVYFRSSWEANYARYLNFKGINWKYEPIHFKLKNGTTYTPDFLLIDYNEYVEIKGYWRDDAKEKFIMFKEQYPEVKIKLVEENEYKNILKENKENKEIFFE